MNLPITVTYPIFGSFDKDRLELSILSAKSQNLPVQIIVSEENTEPTFEQKAQELGVKYIYEEPNIENGFYSPSRVRNRALAFVDTEFVYLNDSDILFLNNNFFENIFTKVNREENLLFNKPPMKRVLLEDFDTFNKWVRTKGIEQALHDLHFPNPFVGITNQRKVTLVVTTNKRGYTVTADVDDYIRATKTSELEGKDPVTFFHTLHYGGIAARTQHILDVGGYCLDFRGWGYQDRDLQHKLAEKFTLVDFPNELRFEVLHLDHPKGYFSPERRKLNKELFSKEKLWM